jgi:uncharacterized protein YukJ
MDRMDLQFQLLQTDRIKESLMNEINAMEEYEADLRGNFDNTVMAAYRANYLVING